LLLSHHVNEFNDGERDTGGGFGFETQHGSYPSFDTTLILLHGVVHVFAQVDDDRFATLSRPVLSIAVYDSCSIDLAAINRNPFWAPMTDQSLADKAFSSFQIAISAEIELNHIAAAIDCTIKIHPLAFDLYIGLIAVPLTGDGRFLR
jgi:hypothetical protein